MATKKANITKTNWNKKKKKIKKKKKKKKKRRNKIIGIP
jgi:hypothetical protein